jgi:hypothetical protein
LIGIENFILILAGITVVAIVIPLLDPTVRNMTYDEVADLGK